MSHHENLAHHAIYDFVEFDDTIEAALDVLDLEETLVIVTADHSQVSDHKAQLSTVLFQLRVNILIVNEGN